MSDNASVIVEIEGQLFRAESFTSEPMARDLDVAASLGYARPRDVRKLIARLIEDKILNDSEVCATVAQTSRLGGRPATEYWLSETGTFKVAAKSDTERSKIVLDVIVRWYSVARKRYRELGPAPTVAAANPIPAAPDRHQSGAQVRDSVAAQLDLRKWFRSIADAQHVTWREVEGVVRSQCSAVSYLRIHIDQMEYVRKLCNQLVYLDLRIEDLRRGRKRRPIRGLLGPSTKQLRLFGEA